MSKGTFVAFLGINNIGKSTQADMLVERIKNELSLPAQYLKFPIYNLSPTGPMINGYLRSDEKGEKNPYDLSPREAQMLYVQNRTHFQPVLEDLLQRGINVVAEDYTGTGIAWGVGAGVDKNFLVNLNSHLLKEDVAILLDGERFLEGEEKDHKHENDHKLTDHVRQVHLELAIEEEWNVVNAKQTKKEVHECIWDILINYKMWGASAYGVCTNKK